MERAQNKPSVLAGLAVAPLTQVAILLKDLKIKWLIVIVDLTQITAILTIATAIMLVLRYTSQHIPDVGYYISGGFVLAFLIEILLRMTTRRVVRGQS